MYFDRLTGKVVSFPSPLTLEIDLPEDFNISKVVTEVEGTKQKLDINNLPLFHKEIYVTEEKEIIVGQDEVLEDTGVPVLIKAQKTNEDGKKIYLENVYDENMEIIDLFETTRAVDEYGAVNMPLMIDEQKKSVTGKLLFYKDIVQIVEEQVLDSVIEVTEDTGKPVLVPNVVNKTYTFKENPDKFSLVEILESKYQALLDRSQKDYIIADVFLNEDDLDLEDPNHSANTGFGVLTLLPRGQAKTKTISLEVSTKDFELLEFNSKDVDIYIAGKKVVDNKVTLPTLVKNCTVKFINNTDKQVEVKAYAIAY